MTHCKTCGAILPANYPAIRCPECIDELRREEEQIRERQRKACGGQWMRRTNPVANIFFAGDVDKL